MGIPSSPETPRRSQAQRVKSTLGTRGLGKHSRQDNTSKPDDGFAFKKSQPVDNNLPNLPIPRPARQYDLASASRVTAFANSNRPFDMRETPQEWLEYHGSILMAKSKQMKKQKTNLSAKEKRETELGPIIHRSRTRTNTSREPSSAKKPTPNKKTKWSDERWRFSSLSSSQMPEDESSSSTKNETPKDKIRVQAPSTSDERWQNKPDEQANNFADVFTGTIPITRNSLLSHHSAGYYLGTRPYFPNLRGREDELLEGLVYGVLKPPGTRAYQGSDPFVSPVTSPNTATPTRGHLQRGVQFNGRRGADGDYLGGK